MKKIILLIIGFIFTLFVFVYGETYGQKLNKTEIKEPLNFKDQENNIYIENLEYNGYNIKYTYYKLYDEVIILVSCDYDKYDADTCEEIIHYAKEKFIIDKKHRYYHYKELHRNIRFSKNNIVYVSITVRLSNE